jgi:hypothetical protein
MSKPVLSADLAEFVQTQLDAQLDDLLSRWHWWRAGYQCGRGYSSGGSATSEYRASRQYDDANGALDVAIEEAQMKQVDYEVSELDDPWHTAICIEARTLCLGVSVFNSPRIAAADRERIVKEARVMLAVKLIAAGVMDPVV